MSIRDQIHIMVVDDMSTSRGLIVQALEGMGIRNIHHAADGRDAEAVPAELVRALVQSLHFELVTYRTDRSELLDRWLDLAESVLTDGVPAALDTFVALQELTP